MSDAGVPFLPLAEPLFEGNEWAYLKQCIETGWVSTAGGFVDRFEVELAVAAGSQGAIAMASGTAALHIALLVAGVGADDEVVMPAMTFTAPANAIRYCGAWPVFTDVSATDWQLDVDQMTDFLEDQCMVRDGNVVNKVTGRRIAALLGVHLLGGTFDRDALAALAARFELPLVEDAAECLGARYKDRPIAASLETGTPHLIITSFNGNKIITTGGGGALFANDDELLAKARHLSSTAKTPGAGYYHDQVGYNYRMTNMAAALGVAQLEKLESYVDRRRAIAAAYCDRLSPIKGVQCHPEPAHCRSIFWMYSVALPSGFEAALEEMSASGIQCRPLWHPIPDLPGFQGRCHVVGADNTRDLCRRAISLPSSTQLTKADVERVSGILSRAVDAGQESRIAFSRR